MIRRTLLGIIVAALSLLGVAQQAQAQKSADTLRIVFRDGVPEYRSLLQPTENRHHPATYGLGRTPLSRPETFEIKPLLATEWKIVDPVTIDFTLRQGVKFHDGSTFSADDAVYTINLVSNPDSKVSTPSNLQLDRSCGEDRRLFDPRQAEEADAGGAAILCASSCRCIPRPIARRSGPKDMPKRLLAPAPTGSPRSSQAYRPISSGSRIIGPAARKASRRSRIFRCRFVPDAATEMTELLGATRRLDLEVQSGSVRQHQPLPTCKQCARNRCGSAIFRSMPPGVPLPATRSPI